jgi:hypothetical protein
LLPKQSLVSPSYDLLVGTPVANRDPSSNSSLQETIAGSVSIADAWSLNLSLGIGVGDLDIDGMYGWSVTEMIRWSQSVTASIPPGQMVHPCSVSPFFCLQNLYEPGLYDRASFVQPNDRGDEPWKWVRIPLSISKMTGLNSENLNLGKHFR